MFWILRSIYCGKGSYKSVPKAIHHSAAKCLATPCEKSVYIKVCNIAVNAQHLGLLHRILLLPWASFVFTFQDIRLLSPG